MIRPQEPGPRHQAFLGELKAALGNSGKDVDAIELLAIASQFVGMLVAMQDQRRYTVQQVMDVVAMNIEQGNQSAVASNLGETGGSA